MYKIYSKKQYKMETLEEIKLLVAKKANCFSWTELVSACHNSLHGLEILNKNINEVSRIYAKQVVEQALKDASEIVLEELDYDIKNAEVISNLILSAEVKI